LQFDLNRDINAAARDVQAAINAARGYLPTNLPSNPTYRKVNPADSPDPHPRSDFRHVSG
jgi:multidrug efflux pump